LLQCTIPLGGLLFILTFQKEKSMFSNTALNSPLFSGATKTLLEGQFAAFSEFSGHLVDSVEKVVALNLAAAKASSEEAAAAAKQLFTVKDPQEFLAQVTAQSKLNAEKAQSYGRHLADIANTSKAGISKTVEAQIAQAKSKVSELVADVSKSAPAGSEQAIAALKSVLDQANAGYEQLTKSAKQAVDAVEANVAKATEQFTQVVEKASAQVVKK
jgi:phasin family protein